MASSVSTNITVAFAEFLIDLHSRGLSGAAREVALMLVRDGIAVASAGVNEEGPRLMRALAATSNAGEAASMIGSLRRTSVAEAARANGVAMHVLDWEPMWNPANHSLSTTLPAILALAEAKARRSGPFRDQAGSSAFSGDELLRALAIGIETQERVRIASGQFEPGSFRFHPPGIVGPLGSAVGCGLLLGLDAKRLAQAISIACSRACAIQANVGSMTKGLHCGQAAASGLESALLAQSGFSGDADAIGSHIGYGAAFFGDTFTPALLVEPRPVLNIVDPGPAWKLFPSQYGTHFVITAALDARSKLPPDATVKAVRLTTPAMPYMDRPQPATGLAGKFSFQYTVAAALIDGRVTPASFTNERRFASDMEHMLARIELVQDPTLEGRFDRMRVAIEVQPEGGSSVTATCDGPPGIWGKPLDPSLLATKADQCLTAFAGPERGRALLDTLANFGSLDGAGLLALMDGLAVDARD
jgi:aconitate decarboxylase